MCFLESKTRIQYTLSQFSLCLFLLVCTCLNSLQAFRPGQAIPVEASELKEMTKTQKKLLYSSVPKYDDFSQIAGLNNILENGGTGLVLDEFSIAFYQFFGDNHCVFIDLAKYQGQLIQNYNKYDFVAIASANYNSTKYLNLESILKANGYAKYTGSYGAVFLPSDQNSYY